MKRTESWILYKNFLINKINNNFYILMLNYQILSSIFIK
jgi:hypothetical protein